MERLVRLQQKIAPESFELIERRYQILRMIYFFQPVGRRQVAEHLELQERAVRNEAEFLKQQGFLIAGPMGMELTEEGEEVLEELESHVKVLRGVLQLEEALCRLLGLSKVLVVPGDSDTDETAKKEMARTAARYLKSIVKSGDIIAVTGGTTMAEVAKSLSPTACGKDVLVVPARGGLGEDAEKQANTVAVKIAQGLGGRYRLLYVPDDLGEEAIQKIMNEPKIQEVLKFIRLASIVMHGIGTAEEMARRRGFSESQIEELRALGAVGEAFGYYVDKKGETVYTTTSIGLKLEDLATVDNVVAVGGGSSKVAAVISVMSNRYQDVLITDEGAARGIAGTLEGRWETEEEDRE